MRRRKVSKMTKTKPRIRAVYSRGVSLPIKGRKLNIDWSRKRQFCGYFTFFFFIEKKKVGTFYNLFLTTSKKEKKEEDEMVNDIVLRNDVACCITCMQALVN